jgi:hypothetical protein
VAFVPHRQELARHSRHVQLYNHLVSHRVIFVMVIGEAFKLRGSPKAPPTTLLSKVRMGTEGNDLTRVKSVEMLVRAMGNPQPSSSVGPLAF